MRDDDRQSAGDPSPRRTDASDEFSQGDPTDGGHAADTPGEPPADQDRSTARRDRTGNPPTQPRDERPPRQQTRAEADGSDVPNWVLYVWDLASSVAIVALIGALLFTASGIWPPMVAVESGSMKPTLERGDLVFVMEADRFPGPNAHESGVVTALAAEDTGYTKFGGPGDVVVYEPDGNEADTPVIHRAMFWVEEGENWLDKADPAYLSGNSVCEQGSRGNRVPNCPAPHAGFITKGDANPSYDQVSGIADNPVKPKWIVGTAELSVPYLGDIRLSASASGTPPTNASQSASDEVVTNASG